MRTAARSGLIAAIVAVFGACAAHGSPATHVGLGEFWVTPDTDLLGAGRVDLSVGNDGEFPHTLVVSDASGLVVGATDLVAPGAVTVLTMNLEAGKYMFTCRIVNGLDDGTVIDHFEEGMASAVEVVASPG